MWILQTYSRNGNAPLPKDSKEITSAKFGIDAFFFRRVAGNIAIRWPMTQLVLLCRKVYSESAT